MAAARSGTLEVPHFDVSADRVDAYQRDGVLLLKDAFGDWVPRLRRGLERNLAAPQAYRFPAESTRPGEPGRFFDSYCNWPLIPEYRDFVFHSAAASLAGQAMGSGRAQFFHEHVFMKEPGTQRATPWHQDLPYYCLSGEQSVSIYIALEAVEQALAVHYIRGSHRWNKLYYPKVWLDGGDFNVDDPGMSSIPDFFAGPDDYDIVSWALQPGDTVLFNFKTVHGTTDGINTRRRSAFSSRWLGDDIRYLDRPGETSPPFPDIGLQPGERMREDWFPVIWRRPA